MTREVSAQKVLVQVCRVAHLSSMVVIVPVTTIMPSRVNMVSSAKAVMASVLRVVAMVSALRVVMVSVLRVAAMVSALRAVMASVLRVAVMVSALRVVMASVLRVVVMVSSVRVAMASVPSREVMASLMVAVVSRRAHVSVLPITIPMLSIR